MKINLSGAKNVKVFGLMGLIVLVIIFMIVAFGNSYFNSPSIGRIITSNAVREISPTLLTVEGKTFSFSYPSSFQPGQSKSLSESDIEKFAYVTSDISPWNLNIQVRKLSGGLITSDSSYNLRKANPDTYTEQVITLNSNIAHIMASNAGGYSKIAFIIHNNIDANISLMSNSSADSEKMDAVLIQIISSWKWL